MRRALLRAGAMTLDQAALCTILAGALVLFVWGHLRHDVVALLALAAALLTGVVPADAAFSGFAHPATVTVALVLVLGRGVSSTGAIESLTTPLLRGVRSATMHVATFAGLAAALSTWMNNVAALALLMPSALETSEKAERSPAVILMPMSFASILGGMVTLIGTPPNIIVATYRADLPGEPFGMFAFTPVGAVVALLGVVFVATGGWRLIPRARRERAATKDLAAIDDYVAEVRVPSEADEAPQFSAVDAAAEQFELSIVALVRPGVGHVTALAGERLQADDVLVVQGAPQDIDRFVGDQGLELVGTEERARSPLRAASLSTAEAVVRPDSPLVGNTPRGLHLRSRHGLGLVAVSRSGQRIRSRLRRFRFRAGDIVLFQGESERLPVTMRQLGCLPLAGSSIRVGAQRRRWLALAIFAAAVVAVTAGWLPIVVGFLLGALAMVLSGVLAPREAYEAIDWSVIVLLGAMIPIGRAVETVGATELVAASVSAAATSPIVVVGLLLAVTMTLSDVMNNAATAVVVAPIAASLATDLGVRPDAFLMAVAVGASCAFLTPIGHQNNTLVLGPGGYRFGDYWRVGLPLEILIVATATPLIVAVWPL